MTKKIEELTKEQIDRFPKFVKKWTDIGLSTEPTDRAKAEAGIIKMYAMAGKSAPKIVWCGSPLSNGLTRHIVQKLPQEKLNNLAGGNVELAVWASAHSMTMGANVTIVSLPAPFSCKPLSKSRLTFRVSRRCCARCGQAVKFRNGLIAISAA